MIVLRVVLGELDSKFELHGHQKKKRSLEKNFSSSNSDELEWLKTQMTKIKQTIKKNEAKNLGMQEKMEKMQEQVVRMRSELDQQCQDLATMRGQWTEL